VPSKPEVPKRDEVPIYIEVGTKRSFATALEWPGWSRSGRDESEAVATLATYATRYAAVVTPAGLKLTPPKDASSFRVTKRVKGNATTEFGAPAIGLPSDAAPLGRAELERLERILVACWDALDRTAKDAHGVELRKGPRGGGRDLDKIIDHVAGAEEIYLVALGARAPKGAGDRARRLTDLREAIVAALRARAFGRPIAEPSRTKTLWTPRFFLRRAAWHVLDHTWEIEDRSTPADLLDVAPLRMPKSKRRASELVNEGRGR
jgi:hypothetical protein